MASVSRLPADLPFSHHHTLSRRSGTSDSGSPRSVAIELRVRLGSSSPARRPSKERTAAQRRLDELPEGVRAIFAQAVAQRMPLRLSCKESERLRTSQPALQRHQNKKSAHQPIDAMVLAQLQLLSEHRLAYAALLSSRLPPRMWQSATPGRCVEPAVIAAMLMLTVEVNSDIGRFQRKQACRNLLRFAWGVGDTSLPYDYQVLGGSLAHESTRMLGLRYKQSRAQLLQALDFNVLERPEQVQDALSELKSHSPRQMSVAQDELCRRLFVEAMGDVYMRDDDWVDWIGMCILGIDPKGRLPPPRRSHAYSLAPGVLEEAAAVPLPISPAAATRSHLSSAGGSRATTCAQEDGCGALRYVDASCPPLPLRPRPPRLSPARCYSSPH